MKPVIRCERVSKSYSRVASLGAKELLVGKHRNAGRFAREWALRDVSFDVSPGEGFGVVGPNGSGKSTLLGVLVGVLKTETGRVTVDGRVVSLLELGSGFHPELTGRQNVFLYGSILGMRVRDIRAAIDRIVGFSELGTVIDNPIRTYSTGMVTRLGFATIVHAPADVLVIDEVLGVGDLGFQQRCRRFLRDFRECGGTLVVVSHDLTAIQAMCDRGLCLDQGRVVCHGRMSDVAGAYRSLVAPPGLTAGEAALT